MNTITRPANHPESLPIWARLALIAQDVPFNEITTWNHETETRIIAFVDSGSYVYLYKR